ncbi:MAG TPA: SIMPL domain-containing protein, partial [Armatimonadota bacterium]|nr:SIMPL domain-containing protein [Armatimonadota bacterium]
MFSRVILLLLACVGLTAGAPAQTMMHVPPPRTISVTGTAERQVPPDLAFAAVAVETQARTVAEAAAQNTAAARRIIDAIQALNLPNLTVRTLTFDVQPVYEQQRPGVTTPPRITGYRVINR